MCIRDRPRGKSFAGYDQQDEYDDVDEDDFAPFVEAVELGYFNNSPVVVSRSNHTAAESSSSDTIASVSSTPKASKGFGPKKTTKSTAKGSEGDGKYPRRAPKDAPTDEGMILGPKIQGVTSKIMGTLDTPSVIFEGVFVGLDKRDTKTGKSIVNGSIVDDTNSIKFIKFTNSPEEGDALLKQLKGLQRVRVQGSVNFDDRFDKDYILSIRSIEAVETTSVERTENRPDSRVELHLHTKMSDKDALVSVKDLFKTVKKWGHPAVAITDHGVVQAFPEAQALGKELGVKVIYGVEGYLIEDETVTKDEELVLDKKKKKEKDKRYHIILLAKNMVGLRNLYKMISISHLEHYKVRPRLPRSVIEEHREGIIIGSACEAGELMQSIVRGATKEELLEIAYFYDYLEIQPHTNNMFLVRKGLMPDEQALIDMNKTCLLYTSRCV